MLVDVDEWKVVNKIIFLVWFQNILLVRCLQSYEWLGSNSSKMQLIEILDPTTHTILWKLRVGIHATRLPLSCSYPEALIQTICRSFHINPIPIIISNWFCKPRGFSAFFGERSPTFWEWNLPTKKEESNTYARI